MGRLSVIILVAAGLVGACGLMLWAGTASVERELLVPITVTDLPQGLTLEGVPSKGIEVRVKGPAKVLDSLRSQSSLVYALDLSAMAPGVHVLALEKERITLPGRLQVKQIQPEAITLRVSPEIRKVLPVHITYMGTPAPGYYATDVHSTPESVAVRGPAERLSAISALSAKPVDISQATADVVKQISLNLPPGVVFEEGVSALVATVQVRTRTVIRHFSNIVVEGRGSDYPFTLQPAHIALEVKGPSNLLEGDQGSSVIKAFVDLKGLAPGVYVRRASIVLPMEARLIGDVDPELFTVQIGGEKRENL